MINSIIFHLKYLKNTKMLRKEIIKYCEDIKGSLQPYEAEEINEVEQYLKKYCVTVFPYTYARKYKHLKINIHRDIEGYPYVIRNEKKLFGPKSYTDKQLRDYYIGLLKEQDKRSPHCYITSEKREPQSGAVIADIGAAEGIFSLDWIEKIEKAYLFECDPKWIDPLNKTFEPWKNKVEIVEKYIGKEDDEEKNVISMDSFFKDKRVDFVKADIEGMETDLLEGGG